MSSQKVIYHTVSSGDFEKYNNNGTYVHKTLESEGFIHCCDRTLLDDILNAYYKDLNETLVLIIDPGKVKEILKYEDLTGSGIMFPHLYGPLDMSAVIEKRAVKKEKDGLFHYKD